MARNRNRTLDRSITKNGYKFEIYSTGAVICSTVDSLGYDMPIGKFANAGHLQELGVFDDFIDLFSSNETKTVRSSFGVIHMSFTPKNSRIVAHILKHKEISKETKSMFILGYLYSRLNLSADVVDRVISVRPDPKVFVGELGGWRGFLSEVIRGLFFPNFHWHGSVGINEVDYKRYCLFLHFTSLPDDTKETFKEFCERVGDDYFVNLVPKESDAHTQKILSVRIGQKYVDDLTPSQLMRYMNHFNREIRHSLRAWMKRRFDSGEILMSERSYGEDEEMKSLVSDMERWGYYWRIALNYLNLEEARALVKYISVKKPPFKMVEPEAAPFIAFCWVNSTEDRFTEILSHIERNNYGSRGILSLMWSNPTKVVSDSKKRQKNVDLNPYIRILESEDLRELPLEWALNVV